MTCGTRARIGSSRTKKGLTTASTSRKTWPHRVGSALTVPTIGWVAKDSSSYGFPSSVFGPQKNQDPYRHDPGDGVRPDGVAIRPHAPTQTSVEAPPEFVRKWVESIRAEDQKLGKRQVQLYFLDNEPSLWSVTHRDVHPGSVELR